mmetsp:Transcript_48375/g.121912  ORF Transcript_48375/g.121912 Transcript_48375/m.121912 type:complete len:439 (-) Transcript_48375:114-1430(-)
MSRASPTVLAPQVPASVAVATGPRYAWRWRPEMRPRGPCGAMVLVLGCVAAWWSRGGACITALLSAPPKAWSWGGLRPAVLPYGLSGQQEGEQHRPWDSRSPTARVRVSGAQTRTRVARRATETDSEGVRYLPVLDFDMETPLEPDPDKMVMPCFPLGEVAYVPDSKHVLNIFEPRYRSMYNDILISGGRRFVVPQITKDEGTGGYKMPEVGVVFYLDDLREVSEQTNDQVKFVCTHSVIGRVRMKRVLNPRAFADRSTYLRVEVEDLVDSDLDTDYSETEQTVMDTVNAVRELQKVAEPTVQFKDAALARQNATRGPGFWGLVSLWQDYLNYRVQESQQRFTKELQTKIISYFESQGSVPKQVAFSELPDDLQKELASLQEQLEEECRPLIKAQSNRVQLLLQSDSHAERLALFQDMIGADKKRLEARLALKSVFDD